MEVVGGIIAILAAMTLLAALGVTTLAALAIMTVLGILTEISFKRLFFISFGLGLLAPILLAAGISSALEDGSLERDLRAELGDVIQFPDDAGANWREGLRDLRDLSRERERGNLSEEEAEQRALEILRGFDDLQIGIDTNGDGVVVGGQGGVVIDGEGGVMIGGENGVVIDPGDGEGNGVRIQIPGAAEQERSPRE